MRLRRQEKHHEAALGELNKELEKEKSTIATIHRKLDQAREDLKLVINMEKQRMEQDAALAAETLVRSIQCTD